MDNAAACGGMSYMPPPLAPQSRRRFRVSAGVLMMVIAGAFVWGLVMFFAGSHTVVQDPVVAERETERALALSALYRFDHAFAAGDLDEAERIFSDIHLPDGSEWAEYRAVRRRMLDAAKAAPAWEFIQMSADSQHENHLLALARDRHGIALLRSIDSGAHWREVERIPLAVSLLRSPDGQKILVSAPDDHRMGRVSYDGGNSWRDGAWPDVSVHHVDLVSFTGDGRLITAVLKDAKHQLFIGTPEGAWTALGSDMVIRAIAPLAVEALLIADGDDHGVRSVQISVDSGRTWAVAPIGLPSYLGKALQIGVSKGEVRAIFPDGRSGYFSLNDGTFVRFGDEP